MKCSKACFHLLVLFVLSSCTKELPTIDEQVSANAESNDLKSPPQTVITTTYGLDYAVGTVSTFEQKMKIAGVKLVRNQLILSQKISGSYIDQYIKDGYNVQINLNWAQPTSGPIAYPTDLTKVKQRAEQFFQYYAPNVKSIPVVVVENEWDNTGFHKGNISDYIAELSAITTIGHKYGFKIADAGLTSTNLRRWTYSTLSGAAATTWATNYFVGPRLDTYATVIQTVNNYAALINTVPIDYLNVHWYNVDACYNGFKTASQAYLKACNKKLIMTNEFGIQTNSTALFNSTVDELRGVASYSISYSNNNSGGDAISLTDQMIKDLSL